MHTLQTIELLERSNVTPFPTPVANPFGALDNAASIMHDLRSPLTAIQLCAELLRAPSLDQSQTDRLACNIDRAVCELRDMLAELVQIARGQSGSIVRCNLRGMLEACAETAGRGDRERVEVLLDVPARTEIAAVRARLERVFVNLFRNAVEAMPGGVTIRVTATETADHVLIVVEDDGPGIPAGIRARLFAPLFTAGKKEGLGLGLALSRQAVREHGGDLWCEPATGARFVLSLPVIGSEVVARRQVVTLGSSVAGSAR